MDLKNGELDVDFEIILYFESGLKFNKNSLRVELFFYILGSLF